MYRLRQNLVAILLMCILFVICDLTGVKKYAVILFAAMILAFLGRKQKWNPELLICVAVPAVVYVLLGSVSALVSGNIYVAGMKTIVFWLLPLVFAFSLYIFSKEKMDKMIDAQFIGSCLAYVLINARFLRYYLKVESMFSFAFGAFFLYFVYKKRWKFAIIAAYFLFITDKRITILAAAAALIVMIFQKLFCCDKRVTYTIWCMVIAALCMYLWMICSGRFEYYSVGVGINTNGRTEMYTQLLQWLGSPFLLLGEGIGIVETLLEAWNIRSFANLHNDILKFYVELGGIGIMAYLLSYGIMFWKAEQSFGNEKASMLLVMTIYSMLLFATDNVSIYVIYLIPYYSILFAVLSQTNEIEKRIENV